MRGMSLVTHGVCASRSRKIWVARAKSRSVGLMRMNGGRVPLRARRIDRRLGATNTPLTVEYGTGSCANHLQANPRAHSIRSS